MSWKVYCGSCERGPFHTIHWNSYVPTWTDTSAVPGVTYWYYVAANRLECRTKMCPPLIPDPAHPKSNGPLFELDT